MTRDRIQHALDIIYEKVFNLGQADLYPGLVSGPYLQHNPLFPNGLDAIVGYIKQAGRIPCEVKRVAIDGDLAFVHGRYLDSGGKENRVLHLPVRRERQSRRALGRAAAGTSLLEQRQHYVLGITSLLDFSGRILNSNRELPCGLRDIKKFAAAYLNQGLKE